MFAEDNVTAQVRYRAVEQNINGDANECEESLLRSALISDTTFLFNCYYFLIHSF